MSLAETINNDALVAMKSADKFKLSVLRMLKSALQLEKINKKHDLNDEEVIAVVKKQIKLRKDSIEEFNKYNRTESVDNLKKEIEILEQYMPEELSPAEVEKIVNDIFNEMQPAGPQDMGKIMKEATARFAGKADLKTVSNIVKEKLNK